MVTAAPGWSVNSLGTGVYQTGGVDPTVKPVAQTTLPGVQYQQGTTTPGAGGTSPNVSLNPAGTPIASSPPTPAPQPSTPPAPQATSTTPTSPTSSTSPTSTTPTGTPAGTQQAMQPAQMPANGSVVDLLNGLGVNSSFDNRSQLASQFGIQGYSGSATQNTQLAQKYLDFYNSKKGTTAPDSGAGASSAIETGLADQNKPQQDPQQSFFDNYMSMNPIEKQMYDTITQAFSAQATQQTFAQQYQDLMTQQGLPALETQRMNIQNVMNGTEDDIRTEIAKAGGFATESQVEAMTGARNKTLLQQANVLDQQIQQKQDYVDQVMKFSEADQTQLNTQFNQKIGLEEKLLAISDKMNTAATSNLEKVVTQVGYSGLIATVKGNPQLQAQYEKLLGLPAGSLSVGSPLAISTGAAGTKDKPQIIGGETSGYFSYDPTTHQTTPILPGTPKGGTLTEGSDLADAKKILTDNPNIDPNAAKQLFLEKHPSSSAAWDNYFGVTSSADNYPKAPPAKKDGLFGWGFLGL